MSDALTAIRSARRFSSSSLAASAMCTSIGLRNEARPRQYTLPTLIRRIR